MNRKNAGLAFLTISIIGWTLFLVFPFLEATKGHRAVLGTAVLVIAEASFIVSVILLGRGFLRNTWTRMRGKSSDTDGPKK